VSTTDSTASELKAPSVADPTTAEFEAFTRYLMNSGRMDEPADAWAAKCAGWNQEEFEALYKVYIHSTQVIIKPGDNTMKLKGRPLEALARYFIDQGGFARDIKEGGLVGEWQVDGVGSLRHGAVMEVCGSGAWEKFSPKVYIEAKNHASVMDGAEFGQHCSRMSDHSCRCGVTFSTAGYAVGSGLGYAHKIFHNFLTHTLHLLLSITDLEPVATRKKYPLTVLRDAYLRTSEESYRLKSVQDTYSANVCIQFANAEFARLFPTTPVPTAS